MRILHIVSNDIRGGAARAAYRLHHGLLQAGVNSSMLSLVKESDDPTIYAYREKKGFPAKLMRHVIWRKTQRDMKRYAGRPRGFEPFSLDQTYIGSEIVSEIERFDVVNFHWVAGFVDPNAVLSRLPKHIPVIWTLHDLNPLTGGCHYDAGCGKYHLECGACPQLGSTDEYDLSRRIFKRKQLIFNRFPCSQLHIVGPSNWIAKASRESVILGRFPVTTIPYGIDTTIFCPRGKNASRVEFGISENETVALLVADSTENVRKGFAFASSALAQVKDCLVCTVGHNRPQFNGNIRHVHFGSITDDVKMSKIYSLADVFVIASLQDNLPNTLLESIACGLPIVGFDVGGIGDVVKEGKTGCLVPVRDVDALARAVKKMLERDELRKSMSVICRDSAIDFYQLSHQAESYINLYKRLLAESSGSCTLGNSIENSAKAN